MIDRRTFTTLLAGAVAAPRLASAQQATRKVALYANVGADLTHYDIDVAGAELIKRETVTLPAGVQYAWPHASRRYLYVASSSSASGYGKAGTEHHVTAYSIDPATGTLSPHGAPIRLPTRPIHISTDIPSENGVQQSERGSRLPHQQGLYTRRGGDPAWSNRRRHLRPPGTHNTRQSARYPGNSR